MGRKWEEEGGEGRWLWENEEAPAREIGPLLLLLVFGSFKELTCDLLCAWSQGACWDSVFANT